MRRWVHLRSWRRLALQASVLAGLGLAFVGGDPAPARAGGTCSSEEQCGFKKPNVMFVLDYSSSMNTDYGNGESRWEVAVAGIGGIVSGQNGFFDDNMHFALIRFGHDPNPGTAGTTISGDVSGLVDGVSLDVGWYDPFEAPAFPYFECNGQAIVDALVNLPAPLCNGNPCSGIGTWTEGGLLLAQSTIVQSQTDHPGDVGPDPRRYVNIVVTDGVWVEQDGIGMNPADDPAVVAADMVASQGADTYVVAVGGDPQGFANELAIAGNTDGAFVAANPPALHAAMQSVLQDIAGMVAIPPECGGGGSSDGGGSSTDPDSGSASASSSGVDDGGTLDSSDGGDDGVDDGATTDPGGESGPPPGTTAPGTSVTGGGSSATSTASATGAGDGTESGTGDGSQDTVGVLERGCDCKTGAPRPLALFALAVVAAIRRRRR